ncbi:MAG TPA: hypothetical protein PLV92_12310 [Pirellulaceae bacterium]|nr:hypothetical protein [Pirellulaceae bacterium]
MHAHLLQVACLVLTQLSPADSARTAPPPSAARAPSNAPAAKAIGADAKSDPKFDIVTRLAEPVVVKSKAPKRKSTAVAPLKPNSQDAGIGLSERITIGPTKMAPVVIRGQSDENEQPAFGGLRRPSASPPPAAGRFNSLRGAPSAPVGDESTQEPQADATESSEASANEPSNDAAVAASESSGDSSANPGFSQPSFGARRTSAAALGGVQADEQGGGRPLAGTDDETGAAAGRLNAQTNAQLNEPSNDQPLDPPPAFRARSRGFGAESTDDSRIATENQPADSTGQSEPVYAPTDAGGGVNNRATIGSDGRPTYDEPTPPRTMSTLQPMVIESQPQRVRPLAEGTSEAPLVQTPDRGLPAQLLHQYLSPPQDPGFHLAGQGVSLLTCLERGAERATRATLVRHYWRLMNDVALYHGAVEENEFLGGLPEPQSTSDQAALNAARLEAQAYFVQMKAAALASQEQLGELIRQSQRDVPPLPIDVPLVGAYQTKFDKIFVNRAPPAGLKRTAQAIPTQHELLVARAAALAAAGEAVRTSVHEYQQGQLALQTLLDSHSRLRIQRDEFLAAVRSYNESIVGYALAVGNTPNNPTLVAMLIKSPIGVRSSAGPASARQIAPNTPRSATVPARAEFPVSPNETSRLRQGSPTTGASYTTPVPSTSTSLANRPVDSRVGSSKSSVPTSFGSTGNAARPTAAREPNRFEGADARPALGDLQWRKN